MCARGNRRRAGVSKVETPEELGKALSEEKMGWYVFHFPSVRMWWKEMCHKGNKSVLVETDWLEGKVLKYIRGRARL